jgi:hypothetical protein
MRLYFLKQGYCYHPIFKSDFFFDPDFFCHILDRIFSDLDLIAMLERDVAGNSFTV